MRTYKFEVTITEGCDEFWEELKGTGCDELLDCVKECLDTQGFIMSGNAEVKLTEFKEEADARI